MSQRALRVNCGKEVRRRPHRGNITYDKAAKGPEGWSHIGLGLKDRGMLENVREV